jgi:bifunctional non-homologous end joining protein LigD
LHVDLNPHTVGRKRPDPPLEATGRPQGTGLGRVGVASFDLVRHHRANERIFLYAFDLIELNGDDLRRDPLEGRNATLEMVVAKAGSGIRFNEHVEGDGETVFRHACKLDLEGIVSKRRDSTYRSGRSPDWLKMKNAAAPAVRREAGGGMG